MHTAGVKYFQHSLKSSRGLWPVIILMLVQKRSAPVGENNFTMSGCGWFDIMLWLRTGLLLLVKVVVARFGGNVFFYFCFCQYPPLKRKLFRKCCSRVIVFYYLAAGVAMTRAAIGKLGSSRKKELVIYMKLRQICSW